MQKSAWHSCLNWQLSHPVVLVEPWPAVAASVLCSPILPMSPTSLSRCLVVVVPVAWVDFPSAGMAAAAEAVPAWEAAFEAAGVEEPGAVALRVAQALEGAGLVANSILVPDLEVEASRALAALVVAAKALVEVAKAQTLEGWVLVEWRPAAPSAATLADSARH